MEPYDDDWYWHEDGLWCMEVTNRFSDEEFQRIVRTIRDNTRHADKLSISCNKFILSRVQALLDALDQNTSIKILSVFDSQIEESVAAVINRAIDSPYSRIQTLELIRNHIEDGGMKVLASALKTSQTVTKLSLFGNKARIKFLTAAIKASTTIQVLRLHSEKLKSTWDSRALAEALKGHASLQAFHAVTNGLSDRAVHSLIEALASVPSLRTLELHEDAVDERALVLIARTLLGSSTLTALSLVPRAMTMEAARALKKALLTNTSLKALTLSCRAVDQRLNPLAPLKVVQALKANTTLEHLDLSNNAFHASIRGWPAKLVRCLQPNQTLKVLNLSGMRLESTVEYIANWISTTKSLTDLDLSSNNLTVSTFLVACALKENRTLKRLSLASNGDISVASNSLCDALKVNTTLQSLDLSGNGFDVQLLCKGMASNTTLTEVDFSRLMFGTEYLAKSVLVLLGTNTWLRRLHFRDNGLAWTEAQSVLQALRHNGRWRVHAVQLLIAAQVILLPSDAGLFQALPLEVKEMVLQQFQPENNLLPVTQQHRIVALANKRDFLSPVYNNHTRLQQFWDIVLRAESGE